MLKDANLQKTLRGSGRRTQSLHVLWLGSTPTSAWPGWEGKVPLSLHPKEGGRRQVIACPFLPCISLKVHAQMAQAVCADLHRPGSGTCLLVWRKMLSLSRGGPPEYQSCRVFSLQRLFWSLCFGWFLKGSSPGISRLASWLGEKYYFSTYYCLQSGRTCQYIGLQDAICKQPLSQRAYNSKHMNRQLCIETPGKSKGKAKGPQWFDGWMSRWAFAI